jgi:hypothetical protein
MANVQFGIDHPVVTVRDLASTREQFKRLGFEPNPVGFHPWGTTLSLLMFKDNFIELISVADPSKFGTNSVGGFCYGRNVGNFLERVEGLGLVALHSKDGKRDHQLLVGRGLRSQGQIDFRREMKKPDGTPDVAVVSLGLFLNDEQRDVSHFICHQHRPELIWVKEWQHHPNGANAVAGVTYLAERPHELVDRFVALYGESRVKASPQEVLADSGCGVFRIVNPQRARQLFGQVELPDWRGDGQPHGIALTVATPRFEELTSLWRDNGVRYVETDRRTYLVSPDQCGNVIMEFCEHLLTTTPLPAP